MSGREQVAEGDGAQVQDVRQGVGQGLGRGVGRGVGQGVVEDAQRRLLLVLRAQHGPQAGAVWCRACSRAGVVSTGQLSAEELDRVAAALAEGTGADAVAGRTCRVRLLFLRTAAARAGVGTGAGPGAGPGAGTGVGTGGRTAAVRSPLVIGTTRPTRTTPSASEVLCDRDVQAAFHQPDALDEAAWVARLAELERELA